MILHADTGQQTGHFPSLQALISIPHYVPYHYTWINWNWNFATYAFLENPHIISFHRALDAN